MIAVDVQASVIAAALGVIIHVVLALLLLFSSVANLLVIIIFFRRPALRTLSNRYVFDIDWCRHVPPRAASVSLIFYLFGNFWLRPLGEAPVGPVAHWHTCLNRTGRVTPFTLVAIKGSSYRCWCSTWWRLVSCYHWCSSTASWIWA